MELTQRKKKMVCLITVFFVFFIFCSTGNTQESEPLDLLKQSEFSGKAKSANKAFHLSLWSTVVPVVIGAGLWPVQKDVSVALTLTGLTLGPAIGHFYVGMGATGGMLFLFRGIFGIGTGAIFVLARYVGEKDKTPAERAEETVLPSTQVFLIGSAIVGTLAILDIIFIKKIVRKKTSKAWSLNPLYLSQDDTSTYGLQLNLTF